jgi:hypothetical protein
MIDLLICSLFGFLECGVPGRVIPFEGVKQYAVTFSILLVIPLQLLGKLVHLPLLILQHMNRVDVLAVWKEDDNARDCNPYDQQRQYQVCFG